MSPTVQAFFDPVTCTVSYIVYETPGTACAIIDSVLDFDPKSGRTRTDSADRLIAFVHKKKLKPEWILETHAHADHLSAASYLRERIGGKLAIGEHIRTVQHVFKNIYNLGPDFPLDGSQFDHLFKEDEEFRIGMLRAQALYVPGHTPADIAYRIGEAVFVGDTLFMPDVGTARCDFPGGDAHKMHASIRKLLALPRETRLFMCHDYPPQEREPQWETSVARQRAENIHMHDGIDAADFVAMRTRRDATLEMPTLMLPAIQINIRAGALPPPEDNGTRYLKIPLNAL